MLLVVSFRPEFVAPWFGRPRVSLMALNRLDRPDATALAAEAVKSHVLSSQLLDRIVLQSDGVPLFIEELTKTVRTGLPHSPILCLRSECTDITIHGINSSRGMTGSTIIKNGSFES